MRPEKRSIACESDGCESDSDSFESKDTFLKAKC